VLFTTPLALLGGAAPAAWLAVARAGGILALAFAYRLGARLAGPAAGMIAAVALALSELWVRGLAHGYSEGLAVALALWAIESHLDGHRGRAVTLAGLVALSRPEAWPFAVAYAAAVVWTDRRRWPLLVGAVIVPPALWLGPDWWGSGDPWHAGIVARVNLLHAGAHPGLLVLRETWGILPGPVWLCAFAAVGLAALRHERTIPVLGTGIAVWIGAVAVATERGYPGSGRFLIVPAGIACVLAGAGAVWVVRAMPARAGVAALLVVAAVPSLLPRVEALPVSARQSVVRARFEQALQTSVARAGGPAAVLHRGRPVVPSRLWWTAGVLAWDLRVPLERIGKVSEARLAVRAGAVVFAPLAGTPPDDPDWVPAHPRARVLARAGIWRVLAAAQPTLGGCSTCSRPIRCGTGRPPVRTLKACLL
jgi:hypothetical protein